MLLVLVLVLVVLVVAVVVLVVDTSDVCSSERNRSEKKKQTKRIYITWQI